MALSDVTAEPREWLAYPRAIQHPHERERRGVRVMAARWFDAREQGERLLRLPREYVEAEPVPERRARAAYVVSRSWGSPGRKSTEPCRFVLDK